MPHVLTISGSLRRGSSNATLLAAVARLAPSDAHVTTFDALAELPAFNPDLEESSEPMPSAVARWRSALADADAVLLSSPEYAHGVSGVLKNALDWVVGSGELVGKPVGLLSASAASQFAHPQLVETLQVMSASLVRDATTVIDIPRRGATVEALLAEPTTRAQLERVLEALLEAARAAQIG